MIFGYNAPNSYGFGSGQGFGFVLAGSVPASVAIINYTNESNEFTYSLDGTGNNIITNYGDGLTTYDGLNHSGESIETSSTSYIEIPLDYTVTGTELLTNGTFDTDLTGWHKYDTGGTITWNAGAVDIAPTTFFDGIASDVNMPSSSYVEVTYTVSNCTGEHIPMAGISGFTNSGNGTFKLAIATDVAKQLSITNWVAVHNFTVDNVSAKEATLDSGCVAIYDTDATSWLYYTSFNQSRFRLMTQTSGNKNGHIVVLASEPSAADKLILEDNINAFADMYFNRATGLTSIVKSDIQHLYIPNVLQGGTLKDHVGTADITIPNYAATMYTNVDQNPKGQQTTNITFDGTGLATGVTYDTMDWGGNVSYMDCGYMPPSTSAWEIDLVMYFGGNGESYTGIYSTATTGWLMFRSRVDRKFVGYIGGSLVLSAALSLGFHHIRLEFDGAGNGKFVIDNTTEHTFSSSTYTYAAGESFFLGNVSDGGLPVSLGFYEPTGYFQYTEGTRTAEERTAAYNAAKLQHPTLP